MKSKRVIVIDTEKGEIREGQVTSLEDMQSIVGGLIELGHITEYGHEIYVNEEGLFNADLKMFYFEGAHQPFAGNAYIIGSVTNSGNNRAATINIEKIKKAVRFL